MCVHITCERKRVIGLIIKCSYLIFLAWYSLKNILKTNVVNFVTLLILPEYDSKHKIVVIHVRFILN